MGCVCHPIVVGSELLQCANGWGWLLEQLQSWAAAAKVCWWAGLSLASCEDWPSHRWAGISVEHVTGAHRIEGEFQNCARQHCHYQGRLRSENCSWQCLSPGGATLPITPSPADTSRLMSGSPSPTVCEFFSLVFLCCFLDQVKFLHEPFKSIFSIPFSSIAFLDIFIIGFQRQRLTSLLEDVRFLMPEVQLKFLALRGDDLYLYDPSLIWTAMAQCGFFLGKPKSLPFLPVLMLSCHPLLWRLYSSSFQVCFWGNYSICSCRFVVWKKVSSGSSYAAILNTLLSFSFQHFVIWILPWSKSIQLLLIRLVRASLILTQ